MLLQVKNLRCGYGSLEIVKGISLHVSAGEIVTEIEEIDAELVSDVDVVDIRDSQPSIIDDAEIISEDSR